MENKEAGNILATSLTYWGRMMSWLEEEIGIPPEPKHPKAVKPAIQTAGGRKTEPEIAESEGKRNRDTGSQD